MPVYEITFELGRGSRRDRLDDAAYWLTGALWQGGNMWGEQVRGWRGRHLVVYCSVPAPDALKHACMTEYARKAWAEVVALCAQPPRTRQLSLPPRPGPVLRWNHERALFLFTHACDVTSPVCAGSNGRPIPAYRLPLDDQTRGALWRWAEAYRQLDNVWLWSGALEAAAYRQLASPTSRLAREGRSLRATVETATGLPTYYFLNRYHAFPEGERQRLCPGCGRAWHRRTTRPEFKGLGGFEFRCDRCRLVSVQGQDTTSTKLARVGGVPGHVRAGSRPDAI